MLKEIVETTAYLQERIDQQPTIGLVLGTGLEGLADEIDIEHTFPYEQIPHFPVTTTAFHSGELLFGTLEGKRVVAMKGRFHYYEGYSMQQITFPIRVVKMLGAQQLLISNAAGGLHPSYQEGDIMVVEDHIDLFPESPLRGENIDELGGRWVDMYQPYDLELIQQAVEYSRQMAVPLHRGVYCGVSGPQLETAAEYRYLRTIGADAVGMSTVPEVIVARHMALPVFAISIITDKCTPDALQPMDVPRIVATAKRAAPHMTQLIKQLIARQ